MESPFPPQLSLAPSNQAGASASASAASPPGPVGLSSDAAPSSSEPRQPRKRARTAVAEDDAHERTYERMSPSDEGAAGQCETRAVLQPRGLYERSNGLRAGSARRVAKERAQQGSERLEWMRRSANDGGVCEPVDKRRRLVADSLGDAAEASHYDSTNGADRQTADFLRPPPLLPIPDCLNASAAIRPLTSPHIGAFPTALAAAQSAEAESSSSLPPPASPLLPPRSAIPAQLPFGTPAHSQSRAASPAYPRPRRRAYSLPGCAVDVCASKVSPTGSPSVASPAPHTPRRRQRPTVSTDFERSRRSLAPGLASPPQTRASFPLAQLDPLALHDAHSGAFNKEVSPRSLARISLVPPITRATLRELDLGEIMRNPQLRHDVVFDPNLMFRPNYDGERCVVVLLSRIRPFPPRRD